MIFKYNEYINENYKKDFHNNILNYIINYLKINSSCILLNKSLEFNKKNSTQSMAGVRCENNKYYIFIDFNETDFGFVRRLSHEMVHVKQIEDGRLILLKNGDIEFDSKIYSKIDYVNNYHDIDFPFEIEAFEQEKEIANSYWNNK